MSKKKTKKSKPAARKAPKKAPKKTVKRKVPKKAGSASPATPGLAAPAPSRRTKTATIFIFKTESGIRIRTAPQRLYANPGDSVEFNVVNLIDDSVVPVTIVFPGGGPWGKEPFEIRNWERKPTGDAPTIGRFKYTITALGAEEDPEVEIPDGN